MEDISLAHAKDHLEELIARAVKGEDIRISDAAFGTVKLAPVVGEVRKSKRAAGRLKGVYEVPEGLFDPLPEDELRRWTGEDD